MKSRLESWHNRFASNGMQAVKALLDSNNLTTPESVVEEVGLHLESAELKVYVQDIPISMVPMG